MAFGPCLLTSRADYEGAGGHVAVRGEILDDVMLAAAYDRAGLPVRCAVGGSSIRMRSYPDGLRQLADGWTSSGDVDATKPQPDLVEAAMDKVDADDAVMVGDSTWDCEAAGRAGLRTVAVLTGGFSEAELRDAGAAGVYHSIVELRDSIDEWLTS